MGNKIPTGERYGKDLYNIPNFMEERTPSSIANLISSRGGSPRCRSRRSSSRSYRDKSICITLLSIHLS